MKKFAFTTAIALALTTTAYAADHGGRSAGGGPGGGGPGGGPGGGMSTMSPGPGGGGPSGMSGGPRSFSNSAGPNQGMSGLHNQSPMTNTFKNNGRVREGNQTFKNNGGNFTEGNHHNFTEGNHHNMYNYGGKNFENREGKHFEGGRDHHGVVSGNFFEHGRHFRFRRFFHGEWVFLNGWEDCTAYAWVNIAPGTWAWTPVDICVG